MSKDSVMGLTRAGSVIHTQPAWARFQNDLTRNLPSVLNPEAEVCHE